MKVDDSSTYAFTYNPSTRTLEVDNLKVNSIAELAPGVITSSLAVDNITGTLTGNASSATQVATQTVQANFNQEHFLPFVVSNSASVINQSILTDQGATYNPFQNRIPADTFAGDLTGNVTGDLLGNVTGDVTGNASTATKIASITNSNIVQLTTTQTLTNKTLTSPTLTTPVLGTPASGNLANCTFPTLNQNTTGSAATLTTARTINGEPFDGSANIATGYADATVGDNSATSITVNHALGSRNVVVQVFETDSPYDQVFCEIERTDANNVELKFRTAPTTNQYTCVVNRVV